LKDDITVVKGDRMPNLVFIEISFKGQQHTSRRFLFPRPDKSERILNGTKKIQKLE